MWFGPPPKKWKSRRNPIGFRKRQLSIKPMQSVHKNPAENLNKNQTEYLHKNQTEKLHVMKEFNGKAEMVMSCFILDGQFVVAGCGDGKIRVYSVQSQVQVDEIHVLDCSVHRLIWYKDYIVAGGANGKMVVLSREFKILNVLLGHFPKSVGQMQFIQGEVPYIVSCGEDGGIQVLDMQGVVQRRMKGHVGRVCCFVVLGLLLCSGGVDGCVVVWNVRSARDSECLRRLEKHTKAVQCLTHVKSSFVISGSNDSKMLCWDIKGTECVREYFGHDATVYQIAMVKRPYMESGPEFVVSANGNGKVLVHMVHKSSVVKVLDNKSCWISKMVQFDAKLWVVADSSLSVWDVKTYEMECTLKTTCSSIHTIVVENSAHCKGVFICGHHHAIQWINTLVGPIDF